MYVAFQVKDPELALVSAFFAYALLELCLSLFLPVSFSSLLKGLAEALHSFLGLGEVGTSAQTQAT